MKNPGMFSTETCSPAVRPFPRQLFLLGDICVLRINVAVCICLGVPEQDLDDREVHVQAEVLIFMSLGASPAYLKLAPKEFV